MPPYGPRYGGFWSGPDEGYPGAPPGDGQIRYISTTSADPVDSSPAAAGPKDNPFLCGIDDCLYEQKNQRRDDLARHRATHDLHSARYPCEQCGRVYTRIDNLKAHQRKYGRCKPVTSG